MKIIVLGAGAWGTALAISASRNPQGHQVTLWARDADQAQAMRTQRENARYLPGAPFPPALQMDCQSVSELVGSLGQHELIVVGSPMSGLRGLLTSLKDCTTPVAWLCKGFEAARDGSYGLLGHEVQAQVAPGMQAGVLSGPSFAQEVAQGKPTALVAASAHAQVRDALVQAFHTLLILLVNR